MLSIILNSLTLLSVVIGITLSAVARGTLIHDPSPLLFYTQQSNLLTGLSAALTLRWRRRKKEPPAWLCTFKHVTTTGITLTLLVFWTMLAPGMSAPYLLSVRNLALHTATPLFAIADHIVCDPPYRERRRHDLFACIEPVLYVLFAYQVASHTKKPMFDGRRFPYYFLDYERYTWWRAGKRGIGVVWWLVLLCGLICGISRFLRFMHRCAGTHRR